MSTFIEYTVGQGTTFKAQLQIKTETSEGMNLVPYAVSGQVRKTYSSANVSANLVCTMIDAANGSLQLSIDHANTANIKAGRHVFDVEALHGTTSEVVRIAEGMITFTPQVTR